MASSAAPRPLIGERPLNRADRVTLVLAAAATLLAFYAASAIAIVLLLALVWILFAVMLGAARFGLSRVISPVLAREWALFRVVVRSFWLRGGHAYQVTLHRADAPRLFAMLDDLSARTHVAVPNEVLVEMNSGAWVRLKGYRRGAGRTILGIGYDLLAGLGEGEVEAVLAHELAHAKLIQRGLTSWLNKGVGRLATLSDDLERLSEENRAANQVSTTCDTLYKGADAMTRVVARHVATYSRQLEFEADLGAAAVCGSAALRSSLLRMEQLHQELGRLPWNERIARLEGETSFSQWLVSEISASDRPVRAEAASHAPDPYSTHPTTRDRLLALPPDDAPIANRRAGIDLLARPDDVAADLVAEIQRVVRTLEDADTKKLAKRAKDWQHRTRLLPLQWPGVIMMLAGFLWGFLMLVADDGWHSMAAGAAIMVAGFVLYRIANYSDALPLPIPKFGTLTAKRPAGENLAAAQADIERELKAGIGATHHKNDLADAYVAECYAQLGARDYLRAHVAGRLAYESNKKSVEAALGLAIASAGLGIPGQCSALLEIVRRATGLRSPMTKWGTVWCLVLLEGWEQAEILLMVLTRKDADQPTFLSLLALARSHRGKLQTAVMDAKRACALEPGNPEQRKLLAELFLSAGRLHDAQQALAWLEPLASTDAEVTRMMVRLNLLQRHVEPAMTWSDELRRIDPEPVWLGWLGSEFETARLDEHAAKFYNEALAAGHYPECLVGLARIDAASGNTESARARLLSALNVDEPRPPFAKSPLSLFHHIVRQINMLDDLRVNCTAWIANFPAGDQHPLSGCKVVVCAPVVAAARAYLHDIVVALQPGSPSSMPAIAWSEAPRDQQPTRPVAPGVQFVMG